MGVLLTGLSLPLFCVCVEPEPGFPAPYVVAFLCSVVLGERWLFVFNIGGINYQHFKPSIHQRRRSGKGKLMRWPEK